MTGVWQTTLVVTAVVLVVAGTSVLLLRAERRRSFGTTEQRGAFAALHSASLAAPPLREGLLPAPAARCARHLHDLLGGAAVAITGPEGLLAWHGAAEHHGDAAREVAAEVVASGRSAVVSRPRLACRDEYCLVQAGVVAPLVVDGRVVGTVGAYAASVQPALVRAVGEVARFASAQLELAELDRSRARLAEAEVRALRAQISPHFVYNSLSAIASFVRTDPDRARELLLEFADYTRYSFRRHGEFTTLAEELRSIDRYLVLERARFGERLAVSVRVAPEVLGVALPFLSVQPLVENAVRHGLEGRPGPGHLRLLAEDLGDECRIVVEDDGVGSDPDVVLRALSGQPEGDSVGLANVDERLRAVYGQEHGLLVETALGAGTKVTLTVPKFAPGVLV